MSKLAFIGIVASTTLISATAMAAELTKVEQGNRLFQYHCVWCHGKETVEGGRMLPGTQALAVRYKGQVPAALEDRTNLPAEFVKYVIRHGIEGMPFYRKTEISDQDADAIAAYLARNSK
jgi:(+)-pinoresinol hydroxylase